MYSTELGRFCQRDPAGYRDGMGLYAGYFAPNAVDPLGLGDLERLTEELDTYINARFRLQQEIARLRNQVGSMPGLKEQLEWDVMRLAEVDMQIQRLKDLIRQLRAAALAALAGSGSGKVGCVMRVISAAGPWVAVAIAAGVALAIREGTLGALQQAASMESQRRSMNGNITNANSRGIEFAREIMGKLEIQCDTESGNHAVDKCRKTFETMTGSCFARVVFIGADYDTKSCVERAWDDFKKCVEKSCKCINCDWEKK